MEVSQTRGLLPRKKREAPRGSTRSFAAQRHAAQDDNPIEFFSFFDFSSTPRASFCL
jgi:hypothetical protein